MAKITEQEKNNSSLIIGIDDAGRGCLIGNMVLAGCMITPKMEKELQLLGAKDSKLLTPKRREELAELIKKKVISYNIHMSTPAEIDTGMGIGLNLNQVEAMAAALIITKLVEPLSASELENLTVIIDCPSINTQRWKEQLLEYLKNKNIKIHCEHKADFNHPVVSAASIIAKTTRDAEIELLKKQIGINFGSGYPADPITKAFLAENVDGFKKERIFRESWSTWQEARNKKQGFKDKKNKQAGLDEF